jgi:probable F420-dependent oxidoreductase
LKLGITAFVTDESAPPDEVARLVEDYGFDSLWLPDHTHIPRDMAAPHPLSGDGLPREYFRLLDVFVALTAAAAATKHLLLGTGVCLVPQRDPIVTAKQVATLDVLSNGRFMFGVGAGWNLDEVRNHGVDPDDRFRVLHERVESMKEIWTNDEASFHGKFVSFDAIFSWPKPTQRPHPPVLLGSNGPRAVERAIRLGAHWMPGRHRDDDLLLQRIAEYHSHGDRAPGVTLMSPPLDTARLARFASSGVDRAIFTAKSAAPGEFERQLENVQSITRGI